VVGQVIENLGGRQIVTTQTQLQLGHCFFPELCPGLSLPIMATDS
jgi:hypothetical protein